MDTARLLNLADIAPRTTVKISTAVDIDILGFFMSFKSKTMVDAKAYDPHLADSSPRLRDKCPTAAL